MEHEEEKPSEHQGADMMDVLLEAFRDDNAEYKITRKHIKSFFRGKCSSSLRKIKVDSRNGSTKPSLFASGRQGRIEITHAGAFVVKDVPRGVQDRRILCTGEDNTCY